MLVSQTEETRHKVISWGISVAIFALLLLFFIFFIIVTPNPPFPITEDGGGGGLEFNIGNMIEGTGNVDPSNGIGEAVKVVESTQPAQPTPQNNSEEFITSDNGEESDIKKTDNKSTQTVVIPVKPREKTVAEKIAEAAKKNQGKSSGGDGNSGQAGDEGRPDGKPGVHGEGGTGGGEGSDKGPGKGPGNGPGTGGGPGGYGYNLSGRAIVTPPPISKDTQEEGTVVVEITVDKTGKVIKAEPTGRGTNTNSPILKAKARQAAQATKFNVSGEFEEQKGTITIVFKF